MFETPLERLKKYAGYSQIGNECCTVYREDLQYLIKEYEELMKKYKNDKK